MSHAVTLCERRAAEQRCSRASVHEAGWQNSISSTIVQPVMYLDLARMQSWQCVWFARAPPQSFSSSARHFRGSGDCAVATAATDASARARMVLIMLSMGWAAASCAVA